MNHIGTREIATERLTLRRFEIEDAENMFYNWANDPEVTKYLTWPAHESVDTTETILKEWISKYDEKDFYQWAIELNDLEQPIGTIHIRCNLSQYRFLIYPLIQIILIIFKQIFIRVSVPGE